MTRSNHRTSWMAELGADERLMAEHIAVKYDAAWRAGWTDAEGLWQVPYCEGMIAATAMLGGGTEFWLRRCIAEFCCEHGYMPMASERPEWLAEHMAYVNEIWADEDAEHDKRKNPLVASRKALLEHLRSLGFKQVASGANATTQWVMQDAGGCLTYLKVHAHRDGSQADYTLCTSRWNPLMA